MTQRLLSALALACLVALVPACGKSDVRATPDTAVAPGHAPADAHVNADPSAATLAQLTQAARKYAVELRQAPKTLDELVAKGYLDRVPPAPRGKRFVIDKNLQVHLANR